uniref:Eukaryotic translation initiation factor 4 gamma, 3b n=1 Tax=Callorhinchus milii TaxID=7868 RepID=A0A4W3H6T3_CALMI
DCFFPPTQHPDIRPQMQAARPSIPNNSPSMRPGAQTATAAVYQPSQGPIIMMNPPVPYPQAPQAQYYIFRPSAAPYVGPPQQYSVQPPPGPFYSGPGPGDFPAYAPSYYSQPVYSPSAPLIVPTQQPPPPTKREKKTIRIRDPNQGGKDITEEIMSGGGGSRNPTPPVVRPSSTPTPPQVPCMPDIFLSQNMYAFPMATATNGCCFLTDEKPKQEAVVKSTSPGIREEEVIEKKETEEEPPDFAPLETEETSAPSDSVFPASDSTDETAPSLPKEEEESAPNLVLHPEIDDSSEKEQVDTDLPEEVLVSPEAVTNTDVNGIEEREVSVSPLESIAQELPPSPTEGEVAEHRTEAGVESPPSLADTDLSPQEAMEADDGKSTSVSDAQEEEVQDKESAEVEEKEVDENESQHLNSRKSPEPVPGRFTMNRKRAFCQIEAFGQPATLLFYFEHVFWVLAEQWKPLNPEGKKRYDREFLLGFQFIPASIQKPEGLPAITDVVLDKVNQTKSISRPLDPSRMLTRGPDFTPSYADFGRPVLSTRVIPVSYFSSEIDSKHPNMFSAPYRSVVGPRRSQHGQRREPRKIIPIVSVNDDVKLKKSENAWKPTGKREAVQEEPDLNKTQDLFRRVRSILNKLTPQMFQQLMKQVQELTIDTEERLKGVINLVFEKAIDEPNFSVAYANMCRCLTMLKVPMADKPGAWVNFRKLLLNRCQKEFEKDKAEDIFNEKRQKEIDASSNEEKSRLQAELKETKDMARRRSIGNIKFIGELFKLKMLTEAIMHDCVVKLLKNHDQESLECLCRLLTTIGKDLDFEKAKPRMDQYFNQMEKIVKERKTSSRIRFMLQDVIDLRQKNWVARRVEQGPKTIEQIHKDAQIEEQQQQLKVHQQLLSKQEKRRPAAVRPSEEAWNVVPVGKSSRTIDPSKFPKITKPATDDKIQLGPGSGLGSWVKGSSGGVKTIESDAPRASVNRFSVLQQAASPAVESEPRRTLPSRSSIGREKNDKPAQPVISRGSSSKELLDDREEERPKVLEIVQQSTSEEKNIEVDKSSPMELGNAITPGGSAMLHLPPSGDSPKSAFSEDEMEKKSKSIIDEFLHITDYKEAVQCVEELNSLSLLHVFVRVGVESTLERSQITREHMGQLFYQLVQSGKLPKEEFFKGFLELLELAEDMAIDIPHIWLYLGELVTPMLQESGISMRELFTEFSKPLLPVERAGVLLSEVLHLLCKQMSHKKVGALWKETELNWKDFLPEGEDVQNFISEKKLEFTVSDASSPTEALSKQELSAEELNKWLEKLIIEDKASNEQIFDWVEANLDESQIGSSTFLRALMTTVCRSAITDCISTFLRVDANIIQQRLRLLLKYLNSDTERELQALYALQALIVKLDQPPNLLRMFFDTLYDEDVISEDAFYKWESSKDPAEQNGKGVALKSVTAFFTWLREAEEESEDN